MVNHVLPAGVPLPKGGGGPRGGLGQVFPGRGCSSLQGRAARSPGCLTCEEADTPQAGVQGHLDLCALVLGQDHALLQVQPVVGADCDAQEAQAADGKDAAQQGQGLPSAGTHLPGRPSGRPAAEVPPTGSGLWRQEREGEREAAATAPRKTR